VFAPEDWVSNEGRQRSSCCANTGSFTGLKPEIEVFVEWDAIVAKAHAVLDTRLLITASI